MSIANYTDLQSAIADWLARPGDTIISDRVADFVLLAESRIAYGSEHPQFPSRPLRIRPMETALDLTTTGGTETVALPDGYLALRSIYLDTSPRGRLRYVTPKQFNDKHDGSTTGKPYEYSIEGENFRFGPVPDSAYDVGGMYYKKFGDLATNSTNWLLTNKPDIYLYGSLIEAAPYIGNDERLVTWYTFFMAAVNSLQAQDERDRHGGELTMQTDTWNP